MYLYSRTHACTHACAHAQACTHTRIPMHARMRVCSDDLLHMCRWCSEPHPSAQCGAPSLTPMLSLLAPPSVRWECADPPRLHEILEPLRPCWSQMAFSGIPHLHWDCCKFIPLDSEYDRAKAPPYNGSDPTSPLEVWKPLCVRTY